MTKPWFRMYRREAGTFAQLPFVARAIFREILCLTDDDGTIFVGNKAPAEAVAFALGADRGDRRAIAKAMDLLLADGCLVHDADVLYAPNFPYFQADAPKPSKRREPASTVQRTDLDGATNEPRTNHEAATTAQRTDHEPTTKIDLSIGNHTLAQSVLSSDSEIDQIRVEREKSARAHEGLTPRPKPRDPMRDAFRRHAPAPSDRVTCDDVAAVFSQMRHEAGGGKFRPTSRDDARLLAAADFANETGTDRESRLRCLQIMLTGGMADEGAKSAGWPFAYVVGDVGKAHAAGLRLTGSVGATTDPVALAQAAADAAENACREARLRKEALAGLEGFSEASRAHAAMQRKLAEAKALVERLSA